MGATSHLVFASYRLDLQNEQLWRANNLIPLRAKPFALLRFMAENPARLVLHEELRKAIWPNTYVSEGVLRVYLREVRAALPKTIPNRPASSRPSRGVVTGFSRELSESRRPALRRQSRAGQNRAGLRSSSAEMRSSQGSGAHLRKRHSARARSSSSTERRASAKPRFSKRF
jgi:hypothetical protein